MNYGHWWTALPLFKPVLFKGSINVFTPKPNIFPYFSKFLIPNWGPSLLKKTLQETLVTYKNVIILGLVMVIFFGGAGFLIALFQNLIQKGEFNDFIGINTLTYLSQGIFRSNNIRRLHFNNKMVNH